MSKFFCSHSWRKGKASFGYRTLTCRKCKKKKKQTVSQFFCLHQWRRKKFARKSSGIKEWQCKKCGKIRANKSLATKV